MSSLIYIVIPISIIAINGPLVKSYIRSLSREKSHSKIELRKDLCYLSKKDNCPIGSYKQCTNNTLPKNFCDCSRKNYELCPYKNIESRNNIAINNLPFNNALKEINYPKSFPRVNIYNSNKSNFDLLK